MRLAIHGASKDSGDRPVLRELLLFKRVVLPGCCTPTNSSLRHLPAHLYTPCQRRLLDIIPPRRLLRPFRKYLEGLSRAVDCPRKVATLGRLLRSPRLIRRLPFLHRWLRTPYPSRSHLPCTHHSFIHRPLSLCSLLCRTLLSLTSIRLTPRLRLSCRPMFPDIPTSPCPTGLHGLPHPLPRIVAHLSLRILLPPWLSRNSQYMSREQVCLC